MAEFMHLSALQKSLARRHNPMTLKVWSKKGEILTFKNCISLRNDFKKGTRLIKLLDSRQTRMIYDCCIFMMNDINIYL